MGRPPRPARPGHRPDPRSPARRRLPPHLLRRRPGVPGSLRRPGDESRAATAPGTSSRPRSPTTPSPATPSSSTSPGAGPTTSAPRSVPAGTSGPTATPRSSWPWPGWRRPPARSATSTTPGGPSETQLAAAGRSIDDVDLAGHAVKALYLASGIAEVALATDEERWHAAAARLFTTLVDEHAYPTGGGRRALARRVRRPALRDARRHGLRRELRGGGVGAVLPPDLGPDRRPPGARPDRAARLQRRALWRGSRRRVLVLLPAPRRDRGRPRVEPVGDPLRVRAVDAPVVVPTPAPPLVRRGLLPDEPRPHLATVTSHVAGVDGGGDLLVHLPLAARITGVAAGTSRSPAPIPTTAPCGCRSSPRRSGRARPHPHPGVGGRRRAPATRPGRARRPPRRRRVVGDRPPGRGRGRARSSCGAARSSTASRGSTSRRRTSAGSSSTRRGAPPRPSPGWPPTMTTCTVAPRSRPRPSNRSPISRPCRTTPGPTEDRPRCATASPADDRPPTRSPARAGGAARHLRRAVLRPRLRVRGHPGHGAHRPRPRRRPASPGRCCCSG